MMTKQTNKGLYGLVLVGGRSSRMKQEKALLEYHGKPQYQFCFDLLTPFCDKLFVSSRRDQQLPSSDSYPHIYDRQEYSGIGPMGGLLSAMDEHKIASWLVLACDMPFVRQKTIEKLIEKRNDRKMATAFIRPLNGQPEPLCTIYEAISRRFLRRRFNKNIYSLQEFLIHSNTELIFSAEDIELKSINVPEDCREFFGKQAHE